MTSPDQDSPVPSDPTVSLPRGFRFAGVTCGIKASRKLDLSLIVCDSPTNGAGVYTKNQIVAAPVVLCRVANSLGEHSGDRNQQRKRQRLHW